MKMNIGIGMDKQKKLTSKVVSLYQEWTTHPQSPILTADYPYQWITYGAGAYRLYVSVGKWYVTPAETNRWSPLGAGKNYYLSGATWTFLTNITANVTNIDHYASSARQTNNDIYTDATLTTVSFAQTTP